MNVLKLTGIMEKYNIKKICPLPAELSEIKKNIPCTEEGCKRMFLNSSNLDMHLLKHHKKANKQLLKIDNSQFKYQYHCPEEKCYYNVNSERFFKNMKYLKQHFLKVHAEKKFYCDTCQKGFSTEAARKKHVRSCGVKFVCSCDYSYDSYEALITHAKRHQHTFDEKFKSYGKGTCTSSSAECSNNNSLNLSQDIQTASTAIAVPVHLLAAVALSELSRAAVDKGVQTEPRILDGKRTRKTASPSKARRGTSTQTQTGHVARSKHPKTSTETQTMGDYILKKAMKAANIPIIQEDTEKQITTQSTTKKRRKSMETQTTNQVKPLVCDNNSDHMANFVGKYSSLMDPNLNLASLNQFPSSSNSSLCSNASPYRLDIDVGLPDLWISQKNSSGTQTSPVAMNSLIDHEEMLSHSVTQTDLNLALFDADTCNPSSSNIHSRSQIMNSLQSYFEDTSNSSFGTGVIPSTPFGSELATAACGSTTLADEPGYSSLQMESILTRNGKLVYDENRSCSIETQTELDFSNSFLTECTNDGDTSFTLCSNIETQTTEDISSLDHLIYTNMCTQTCDEVLFSDLGFVDIQTQTAWPQYVDDSVLVSTETQTALCGKGGHKPWLAGGKLSTAGTSHMETQTNTSEFREFIAALAKQDDKLL